MTRPGDPRAMLDVSFRRGYTAGFDDATEARGGMRLAGCLVVLAALVILCAVSFTAGRVTAAPRRAQDSTFPVVAPALLGAPHVRGALDSGNGNQTAEPSGGAVTTAPTTVTVPHNANALVRTGLASTYGEGWDGWTAWPAGPGYTLRVCGQAACVTVVSNDAGPSLAMQRQGRIIDLDAPTFERVSGQPWRKVGLANVSVTVLRVPR